MYLNLKSIFNDDGYAMISFQKKLASKHSHLNLFTIFDLENSFEETNYN